jgi:putative membrane protein
MFYLKALHIIFVVTWFAGLFYIVRLFIYHTEAEQKEPLEKEILQRQYRIMEKRLWCGITWPSAVLAVSSGLYLAYLMGFYGSVWLWTKLGFVAGLVVYHLITHRMFAQLQKGEARYSSMKLRVWNEVATLFLVSIVFIVVLKDAMSFIYGVAGLLLFAAIIMLAIRIYRRMREAKV